MLGFLIITCTFNTSELQCEAKTNVPYLYMPKLLQWPGDNYVNSSASAVIKLRIYANWKEFSSILSSVNPQLRNELSYN